MQAKHRFSRKIDINKKNPKIDALINKPKLNPPPGYRYIRTITKQKSDKRTYVDNRPKKLPRKIYYNRIHHDTNIYYQYNIKYILLVFISIVFSCIIIIVLLIY